MKLPLARSALVVSLLLAWAACSPARRILRHEPSGFLLDYARLERDPMAPAAASYVAPAIAWSAYDRVLFEPVTIWRSGTGSLAAVPHADLARLAVDLDSAVRRRLARQFTLVNEASPGVMRIRLAVTAARASDTVKDVMRLDGSQPFAVTSGSGVLHPEIRRFLQEAAIEGEILDAATNDVLAMGIEQRDPGARPFETWEEVDRALDAWAARVVGRLERRGERP